MTIRESEAIVIRECAARLLAGEALRSICSDLNERGVPTSTGGAWQPQTLSRMLQSARIAGQREHKGEIVADAEWPAIISPAESTRIRGLLSDPDRRTNKVARRYLLVRLLRCGLCGETLVSRPKQGGVRAYQCVKGPGYSGCGRISVKADPLEQFVVEAVLYRLDSPELAAAMSGEPGDPDAERWQAEIEQSRQRLDGLAEMHGEGEISLSEWRAARTPIERRVTDARKQLGRLSRTTALAGQIGHGTRATRTLGIPAANPAARDRRRRPRPRRRRPLHPAWLQQVRPVPLQRGLARLTQLPTRWAAPGQGRVRRPAGQRPGPAPARRIPAAVAPATHMTPPPIRGRLLVAACQPSHITRQAGGPCQPSVLDERQTCDGSAPISSDAWPITSSTVRPASGSGCGLKPCPTS